VVIQKHQKHQICKEKGTKNQPFSSKNENNRLFWSTIVDEFTRLACPVGNLLNGSKDKRNISRIFDQHFATNEC